METVLVTGGSGFIGGWCVIGLLEKGYTVRTTVRDLAKEGAVRTNLAKATSKLDNLTFYAANLTDDAGWDDAVQGCDYVLHVASPIAVAEPKDPDVLITPAREGALRAINASIKAGVKRVVMTSSVAAASPHDNRRESRTDEAVWTDPTIKGVSAYSQSKTLAERAAWARIETSNAPTSLATVNPALVIGPVLDGDFSGSAQVVERLLSGRVPGLPRLGFNIVDVRDVADLHIRAMTAPEARSERFIAAGQWAWMEDIARILRDKLGADAAKVPANKVPDLVLQIVGLFDRDLGSVTPNLGRKGDFSSEKAQRVLGWTPRPLEETILDCAKSYLTSRAA